MGDGLQSGLQIQKKKDKASWDEIFKDYTIIFKNLSLYYNESYSSLSLDSLFQDIHQMRV